MSDDTSDSAGVRGAADSAGSPSASLTVTREEHVALVRFARPPNNHLDAELMARLADTFARLDEDETCRAVVLASEGRIFCAGADFSSVRDRGGPPSLDTRAFYANAMRLFDFTKPVVAAIQGPAIGAGVGLALAADFRITCPGARFSVNFNRLGFHPGFGLSCTLPRLIGSQHAALLFFTGRRIDGAQAVRIGLADELVDPTEVLVKAHALAAEIAASAPLAVRSTRAALREGLAAQVRQANAHELSMQTLQFASSDFQEGVQAMAARRAPRFQGR